MSKALDVLVIVGTGMMGSSVAAAAKKRGVATEIIGIDPQAAGAAKDLGIVDHTLDSLVKVSGTVSGTVPDTVPDTTAIAVVIASPVKTYPGIFSQIASLHSQLPLRWVTDIGSTKAGVISASPLLGALAARFVSSHPMAGSERQGPQAANPDLFAGARVLISRLSASGEEATESVEEFWLALGADPTPLPIEDHDALLAAISHLPHVLAYALAGSLAQGHLAGVAQALHGGGLRDTTRIAASSPEIWADIFLDNREALLHAWADWSLQLQAMHQALETQDRAFLLELLTQAAQWRKGFQ